MYAGVYVYTSVYRYIHGDSIKSKPNFIFHICTSNLNTVFNIFVKKLSVVWFDCLIKEDVQNVLLLLARKPGGAGAIGQQHRRQGQRFLQCADLRLPLPMTRSTDPVTLIFRSNLSNPLLVQCFFWKLW